MFWERHHWSFLARITPRSRSYQGRHSSPTSIPLPQLPSQETVPRSNLIILQMIGLVNIPPLWLMFEINNPRLAMKQIAYAGMKWSERRAAFLILILIVRTQTREICIATGPHLGSSLTRVWIQSMLHFNMEIYPWSSNFIFLEQWCSSDECSSLNCITEMGELCEPWTIPK